MNEAGLDLPDLRFGDTVRYPVPDGRLWVIVGAYRLLTGELELLLERHKRRHGRVPPELIHTGASPSAVRVTKRRQDSQGIELAQLAGVLA